MFIKRFSFFFLLGFSAIAVESDPIFKTIEELRSIEREYTAHEKKKTPRNAPALQELTKRAIEMLSKTTKMASVDPNERLMESIIRVAVYASEVEPTGYPAEIVHGLYRVQRAKTLKAIHRIDASRTRRLRELMKLEEQEIRQGGNG